MSQQINTTDFRAPRPELPRSALRAQRSSRALPRSASYSALEYGVTSL